VRGLKMNKRWFYLLVFLFGIGLGLGVIGLGLFFQDKSSLKSQKQKPTNKIENKFILAKKVSGFLVSWDQDEGFISVQHNKNKISSIKPVWYKVKADASIKNFSGAEAKELIKFAKENNIKIIPSIANDCEPYETEQVIKSEELINKHIANILNVVEENNFDGIDIDYECLSGTSLRAAYSNFMTRLASQIHAKHKILTTAVHAKSSDLGNWDGPAVQDWKVLGEACDQILIMTYDYHWSTSEAGDIAPIPWMEEILSYAIKTIKLDKIYLGINFYGYDWVGKQGKILTYSEVLGLIGRFNPQIAVSAEGEKYFNYIDRRVPHTVYFADYETIERKVELVKKYKVAGIGIWRLGGEDSKNWETIEKLLK